MTRLDLDLAGSTDDASWSLDHNPAGQITSRTLSNDDHGLDKQNLDLFGDYNLLDQIDTVMGAVTFDYDDRGNWISNGSDSFTYDLYNRLVSADRGAGARSAGAEARPGGWPGQRGRPSRPRSSGR